jgi:NADH:ubiquinone oxidoreductase subunit 6 (subunit J)
VALPSTVPYLNIPWDDLVFLALAGVLLGGALLVVLGRDIIRSGLWMILSFAALAGIYALLGAPLVAAAQVLVYIGAISVLILFAIMLTQSKAAPSKLVFHHQAWAAAVAAVFLGLILIVVVVATGWQVVPEGPVAAATQRIAQLLFGEYVLPFEVVSVLLLAAVIGGVFLAKREEDETEDVGVDLSNPPAVPPLPITPPALATGIGSSMSRPAEEP